MIQVKNNYTVNKYNLSKDATLLSDDLTYHKIIHMLSGEVQMIVGDTTYDLLSGDTVIISEQEVYDIISINDSIICEVFEICILDQYVSELSTTHTDLSSCFSIATSSQYHLVRTEINKTHVMRYMMEQLSDEVSHKDYKFASDVVEVSNLSLLLSHIGREVLSLYNAFDDVSKNDVLIDDVIRHINDNYQSDISLDSLSEVFFISKYHLSRLFKESVGSSLYQYVLQKRLEAAKDALKIGKSPKEAYLECGFNDYSNFYRAFLSEFKMTPKEYSKSKNHN